MAQKATTSQNTSHRLSPHHIQLMKLFQVPTLSITDRILEEMELNPTLVQGDDEEDFSGESQSEKEEGPEVDAAYGDETEPDEFRDEDEKLPTENYELDDYLEPYMEDDPSLYYTQGENSNNEEDKTYPMAVINSFSEYLEEQLGLLSELSDRQIMIAKHIIGTIEDDGYLRRDTFEIVDDIMMAQNMMVSETEINEMLTKIQQFDPPGIGARNLQECLVLQIKYKIKNEKMDAPTAKIFQIALRIINENFIEFTKRHFPKIQRQLDIDEEMLRDAIEEIVRLNPKPATGYTSSRDTSSHYIIPDFEIATREGRLELVVDSRNIPDLRISEHYKDMLKSYKNVMPGGDVDRKKKDAIAFIKNKIESAKWFIDAIRQREQTMYRTMFAIMQYQQEFFETGDEQRLRPMILKDIADMTGLDISTVSRVANSKYVQTEFGIKLLKSFFSESLQTDEGDEVSTLEVKKILTDIITAENKRKPFSDEKLKSLLKGKSYNIARRTVAKYREQLNIPVARLRRGF